MSDGINVKIYTSSTSSIGSASPITKSIPYEFYERTSDSSLQNTNRRESELSELHGKRSRNVSFDSTAIDFITDSKRKLISKV